ncbi:class I SAM-dependent RNA methyltransferase [Corynebacterium tapiri]|uniref:Class I SAM-dependent RNA methyltransferase n=1 Tax=Corynebacterium tapiri TaxID=1448266 RepID=A0A5C4U595_9CORY|nr:class I SAM-dependent RNA methyltransferase [Corynebacterium tapiri]
MALSVGDRITCEITRMAHGGEGIGHADDGRVVFVADAFPGDTVDVTLTQVKKKFLRGQSVGVVKPSQLRGPSRCAAADAGAGCCDFHHLREDAELEIKKDILLGQLSRVASPDSLPQVESRTLQPTQGWRTRVRLGVDAQGRAGFRRRGSRDIVAGQPCSQVADGVLDGVVDATSGSFAPGAELVAVRDSQGRRHLAQTAKASRGRRVETVTTTLEGPGEVTEKVGELEFRFPPTAFWQAHVAAPAEYCRVIEQALDGIQGATAWDLYGGVGLFAPVLAKFCEQVVSVDYSDAADTAQPALEGLNVRHLNSRVDGAIAQLPAPDVVVLDPPRTGAGHKVISDVAAAQPRRVVHIGCDPATFSRDLGYWLEAGYSCTEMVLIDAFPGTHHFEVISVFER